MTDTFTEVTTKSWGNRIVGSIFGVLLGIVLIIASCIGLFWNEGRAVQTAKSLAEGAGLVVDITPTSVDPGNEGKLVHVTGDMKAGIQPKDAEFGVSADGLRLVRTVEMYQWVQEEHSETKKNVGGSEETVTTYTYVRKWSDAPVDSSRFKVSEGHVNPAKRYNDATFAGGEVTLGAFRPSERVVAMLPARQELRVDAAMAEALGGRVSGQVQANDGRFYLGADPSQPRIGDMRISYRFAPAGAVSIVGRQAGSDFADYQTHAGDTLLMVRPGSMTAADMFEAAKRENTVMTWIIRAVGAAAMMLGFALILNPLVVVADVIPFIGNILGAGATLVALMATAVLAPVVIAIAWFWYRPLIGILVLAAGAAIAYGLRHLAHRKIAARQSAPAAA